MYKYINIWNESNLTQLSRKVYSLYIVRNEGGVTIIKNLQIYYYCSSRNYTYVYAIFKVWRDIYKK